MKERERERGGGGGGGGDWADMTGVNAKGLKTSDKQQQQQQYHTITPRRIHSVFSWLNEIAITIWVHR